MVHTADTLVLALINALYIIFSIQLFTQARGRTAYATIGLGLVFILCAFSGYGSPLLAWFLAPETVWWIREGLHWMLMVVIGYVVFTNQARVVSRLLDD